MMSVLPSRLWSQQIVAQSRAVFYTALLCLSLAACSASNIEVIAEFNNTQDIEEGTAVYFDQSKIGEVSEVESVANGSRVVMQLDQQAATQVYAQSAAVLNRLGEQPRLDIFNRQTSDTQGLQDGQTIQGLDSMVELGAWMLGDAIQAGVGAISDYVGAFQNYLESDEFKADKQQLEIEINGAAVSAEEAMQTLGRELNNAMSELAESEQEIAVAIDDLGDQLAPVVEDLAANGSRLANEMEQFAQNLEQSSPQQREASQQLIESLISLLEKLNDSLEKGAKRDSASDNN